MRNYILPALVTLPLCTHAQGPLTPLWVHTWEGGQDLGVPFAAPSADNHVAWDAVGNVLYMTMDDPTHGYRWDLLRSFLADGTDITPVPAPHLGSSAPSDQDAPNIECTWDLVADDGVVYHTRELNTGIMAGTTGSLCARRSDGSSWRLGLGKRFYNYGKGHVLVDDQAVFAIRSLDGQKAAIHATDLDGWLLWSKTYTGFAPFDDAVVVGEEIVAMRYGTMVRIDRNTGTQLSSVQLFAGSYTPVIATDGTRIFYAYTTPLGNATWQCATLDGTILWTRSAYLDITPTEIEIDAVGRPWFTGNVLSGSATGPLLVVTATDGSAHDLFTYGASMNDLVIGGDQAYITGRVDNDSEVTYLIGVSADMTTVVAKPMTIAGIALYPQPANTMLNVANAGRLDKVVVRDATGKTVRVPLRNATTLDVGQLSEGVYFLQAVTASGPIARRFAVSR